MTSKFNDALEMLDSLSIEEQEEILEIEKKRIIEKKRKLLFKDIEEAENDIERGDFITGTPEELVKATEKEAELISKRNT